jgi:hypothetical protein
MLNTLHFLITIFIPNFLFIASIIYSIYIGLNIYVAISNKKNIFELISMMEFRYAFLTITYIITFLIT